MHEAIHPYVRARLDTPAKHAAAVVLTFESRCRLICESRRRISRFVSCFPDTPGKKTSVRIRKSNSLRCLNNCP